MQNDFDTIYKLASSLNNEEKKMMGICLSANDDVKSACLAQKAYDWLKGQNILDDNALESALSATPHLVREALRLNNNPQDLEDNPASVYMAGCHPTIDIAIEEIKALKEDTNVSPTSIAICRNVASAVAKEENGATVCHMADFDDLLKSRLKKLEACDSLSFFKTLSDDKALGILSSKDPLGEIKKTISKECRWIEWMAFVCL